MLADFYNQVFYSFWTFAGTVILLGIVCGAFAALGNGVVRITHNHITK